MSTLRGQRISRVELHVPSAGSWTADVTLERGGLIAPGPAELKIADMTLQGRVLPGRGGLDGPDQPSTVVMGGAGWRSPLSRKGEYSSPVGVRLLTVLRDLAALAGESFTAPAEKLLGSAYEWSAATASFPRRARAVLDDLVARGALPTWRVPLDGVTRFDSWPSIGAADAFGRVIKRRLTEGVRYVGLDTRAAAFLPGATLEGVTVRRVIFIDTAGSLSAEVWS